MTDAATRPLPTFADLRLLARTSPITSACIGLVRMEVRAAEWDIVLTAEAVKALPGTRVLPPAYRKLYGERREQAVRFFRRPDPDYGSFGSWIDVVTREILETDSLALNVRRTQPGKGLLGSSVAALEVMDGATVHPGAHGCDMYSRAVRRVTAAELAAGTNITNNPDPPREYGPRELLYRPMRAPLQPDADPFAKPADRPREPFGRSPVEDAIAYAEDGSADLAATEAGMAAAFGLSRKRLGMDGEDDGPGFDLAGQVRAHLKGIFDFVLQDLCGATVLEWKWEGDRDDRS